MNSTIIGMKLTQLRKERGQTRAFVAKQLGVSYGALFSYEHGTRVPPDSMKIKLARYYGMSVEALFYDT